MSNPDCQVLLRSFTPVDSISDEEVKCLHAFPQTGSETTQGLSRPMIILPCSVFVENMGGLLTRLWALNTAVHVVRHTILRSKQMY